MLMVVGDGGVDRDTGRLYLPCSVVSGGRFFSSTSCEHNIHSNSSSTLPHGDSQEHFIYLIFC